MSSFMDKTFRSTSYQKRISDARQDKADGFTDEPCTNFFRLFALTRYFSSIFPRKNFTPNELSFQTIRLRRVNFRVDIFTSFSRINLDSFRYGLIGFYVGRPTRNTNRLLSSFNFQPTIHLDRMSPNQRWIQGWH